MTRLWALYAMRFKGVVDGRSEFPLSVSSEAIMQKPSPTQTQRILNGVQQIGSEIAAIRFLL